ncbi:hypothetical protein D3C85_1456590 [compost metagenome]
MVLAVDWFDFGRPIYLAVSGLWQKRRNEMVLGAVGADPVSDSPDCVLGICYPAFAQEAGTERARAKLGRKRSG